MRRARNRSEGRFRRRERTPDRCGVWAGFPGSKRELQDRTTSWWDSWEQFRRAVILPQGSLPPSSTGAPTSARALLERMTGTELYSGHLYPDPRAGAEEQQKRATIAQRSEDVALMDEAIPRTVGGASRSASTTTLNTKQQQQLMQDLRDLNSRIAAQMQGCCGRQAPMPPGAGPTARLPRAGGSSPAPSRPRWPAPITTSWLLPHPGAQQQEKVIAELGPELASWRSRPSRALTEQQLLAEKIAAESEWGALQPELKRAQELDTRIREKCSSCRRSSKRGRRSEKSSSPGSRLARAEPAGRAAPGSSTSRGPWFEEHKELAPVGCQWQPPAHRHAGLGRGMPTSCNSAHPAGTRWRALQQLQHQLEQGQQECDYWQQEQTRLQQHSTSCRRAVESRLAKAQEQWQQQTEHRQLRQLLSWLGLWPQPRRAAWSPAAGDCPAEQALGAGHPRRRAGAGLRAAALQRDEARHALEQSRAIASFEQHRHILSDGEPCPLCGAEEHPYHQSQPQVAAFPVSWRARPQPRS